MPFTYESTNTTSLLTITGAGQGSSILDGAGVSSVISLTTQANDADVKVSQVTIQNGKGGAVAGLRIVADHGKVALEKSEIKNNIEGTSVGGVF
ncbi:MAG TPA: hypothetical protein DF383_13395, partial [Deltaproteobacteria bacterium]|nr:hypothetical protein [Deltaproteobacteria bacterium]